MFRITQQQGLVTALGVVLAITGCDSDEDGKVEANASVDPATAQLALNELSTNVDATITGFSEVKPGTTAANQGVGGAVDVKCSAGGDAMVEGYVNVTPLPVNVDVKVAITYDACLTSSGTTLRGELDFSQTVMAGPGAPLRVETIYTGDVVLTGKVNARCPVDLNVLVDETGRAMQLTGQFCGQDAGGLSLQVSPRWNPGNSAAAQRD